MYTRHNTVDLYDANVEGFHSSVAEQYSIVYTNHTHLSTPLYGLLGAFCVLADINMA